jgi:hypothetical protein
MTPAEAEAQFIALWAKGLEIAVMPERLQMLRPKTATSRLKSLTGREVWIAVRTATA